ncbi:MAG: tRNA uracil 4-sulfurtransferase ThiI [bacterium]
MKPDCIIVHYHEIALKGANRIFFERQLRKNILRAGSKYGIRDVELLRGRIMVYPHPECQFEELAAVLKKIFGIAYYAQAYRVEQGIDRLTETALQLAKDRQFASFRIATHRSQKSFPLTSVQVNTLIGEKVREATGAKVDLKNAEFTIHIEIFDREALVYCDRFEGAGGLPVGVSNRALVLLSSGIDSPVASYKIMRRGVILVFVHFHSVPYTSAASIENTKKLVEHLTQYQYKSKLYLVPFLEIQQHITSVATPAYRVILYRRMMMRIAEKIAYRNKAKALVTGENIGQVASQTLPNILAINETVSLPVLRPLAGDDKQDIIRMAEKIGTFKTSIEPYDDCCSLFVPGNPETHAKMKLVREYEDNLDLTGLVVKAVREAELTSFEA